MFLAVRRELASGSRAERPSWGLSPKSRRFYAGTSSTTPSDHTADWDS